MAAAADIILVFLIRPARPENSEENARALSLPRLPFADGSKII